MLALVLQLMAVGGVIQQNKGCIAAFIISFIPPRNIPVGGSEHFEILLVIGLVIMSLPPFCIFIISEAHARACA